MAVQWTAEQFISAELGIELDISRNLVALFEDGNEVAFIARYRRHLTGNASPDDLRHALDAFNTAKAVKAKAEKLLKRVEGEVEDAHQKTNLKHALSTTMDANELDVLFEPFKKTKKGTLASRASTLFIYFQDGEGNELEFEQAQLVLKSESRDLLSYALANQRKFSHCCVCGCHFFNSDVTEGGSVEFVVYNALHRLFPASIHVEASS
uniref:Tex-like protein N-terminal domain-containing protein n=1 Tax=Parascaris equorum TaxID=6256 RepID=A0A914RJ63_PAREQ